jgi:hypothetical protein
MDVVDVVVRVVGELIRFVARANMSEAYHAERRYGNTSFLLGFVIREGFQSSQPRSEMRAFGTNRGQPDFQDSKRT